jgi:hypothetical protein
LGMRSALPWPENVTLLHRQQRFVMGWQFSA